MVKMGSIEGAREEMLLIPPPDVVPMWGQMEDCCGCIQTQKNVTNWRVARHGSLQLDKEQVQIRETDQAAHLPVCIHLCETRVQQKAALAVRLPNNILCGPKPIRTISGVLGIN